MFYLFTGSGSSKHLVAKMGTDQGSCTCFASVYIERVFSICGMLSQGRRNRMSTLLEMRVHLKLNAKALA